MMIQKLKMGIALENKKESQLIQWAIKRLAPPKKVWIPLQYHEAMSALPVVAIGQKVLQGQKIADPGNDNSVALHASYSGTVIGLDYYPHAELGEVQTFEILVDKENQSVSEMGQERLDWESISSQKLCELFQNLGLLNLKAPAIALHQKALQTKENQIKTLVVNACETEPYVSCDYSLIMSHTTEILKGAELFRKACEAKEVIVVLCQREREAAELLKSKIFFLKWNHVKVEILSSLHPQGEDEVVLKSLEKRGYSGMGIEGVVNVASVFAVYEAIVLQKPFFERVVTLGGECLVESKNVWLSVGTRIGQAIKANRGFLREPRKVLMGGPMKGLAQMSLEVALLPQTQAILALPKEVAKLEDIQPCIRCGKCIEVCPVDISPAMITLAVEFEDIKRAKEYGAQACIDCGNCAYVCPSKRPMVELITYARNN